MLELRPAKSIVALKNVSLNEPFFQGHFPEWKIMPGVLIVEAIAQAGGVLLFHSIPDPETQVRRPEQDRQGQVPEAGGPGDQLRLDVLWVRQKGRIIQMKGKAFVEGELAAEAEITATVLDVSEVKFPLT